MTKGEDIFVLTFLFSVTENRELFIILETEFLLYFASKTPEETGKFR